MLPFLLVFFSQTHLSHFIFRYYQQQLANKSVSHSGCTLDNVQARVTVASSGQWKLIPAALLK